MAIGFRHTLSHRWELVGRTLTYILFMLIFSKLWAVALTHSALAGRTPVDMLWYIAVTEWIIVSLPSVHLDIEGDIRSGDIASRLPKPISFVGSHLAQNVGTLLAHMLVIGTAGLIFAPLCSGGWPTHPSAFWSVVPLGIAGGLILMAFQAGIGMTAVWLQDASPVFWIWQKMSFVLGGLLIPLDLYPGWLQRAAAWTPFHTLIYGPGSLIFSSDSTIAPLALWVRMAGWGACAALVVAWISRRALRALTINGG